MGCVVIITPTTKTTFQTLENNELHGYKYPLIKACTKEHVIITNSPPETSCKHSDFLKNNTSYLCHLELRNHSHSGFLKAFKILFSPRTSGTVCDRVCL